MAEFPQTDAGLFREIGHRIIEVLSDSIGSNEPRKLVGARRSPDEMEALFGGPVPEFGTDADELISLLERELVPSTINVHHPRLLGMIIASPLPLTGLMGALVNTLALGPRHWRNFPASTQMEATVIRWLGKMVGFSDDAAGHIPGGGSAATLEALAIARRHHSSWDIERERQAHPNLVAFTSCEAHSSVVKAMELLGLGRDRLIHIPVDSSYRMCPQRLKQAIVDARATGLQPFCVIATAGTTNTGAIDPLQEIAEIAHEYGLWLHVDGAYGAFAAMIPEKRDLFEGIHHADSLAMSCHKWLNVPIASACLLVHRWSDLRDTFSHLGDYVRVNPTDAHSMFEHGFAEYGFELTRPDRALTVWWALKQFGTAQFINMFRRHLQFTEQLRMRIDRSPDLELAVEPSLSVCCFRFTPIGLAADCRKASAYVDDINSRLPDILLNDHDTLIYTTVIDGRPVLRSCFVSHRITTEDVEHLAAAVSQAGRSLDTAAAREAFGLC